MNGEIPDEFIELLELLEEGTLDESGRARLAKLISERPALRQTVSDHFAISRAISQLNKPQSNYAGRTAAHIAKIAAEADGGFAKNITRRIVRKRIVKGLAIAAVLALAILPFVNEKPAPTGPEVAAMIEMDSEGEHIQTKPVHAGNLIEMSTGLVRLDFDNGAVIAIEAPAKFTVVSKMEILLESGRLNGWCPGTAHGFKVRTRSASLKDLGTSFGISVDETGKSEFMVLDGLVEVQRGGEKVRLAEGAAIESDTNDPMKAVSFDPSGFRNTWPLSLGILSTRGAVVPADPDVSEKLLKLEDDNHVLVIPERREIPFRLPIKAELVDSGTIPEGRNGNLNPPVHEIQPVPGKLLSSFIMRYNPVGVFYEERFLRFEGEVTFDRPVLAIACQEAQLSDGDRVFATGEWTGPYRGIETVQRLNPPDSVTLSEDRRTVKVIFYAGQSTDDIRVILEDN